MERNYYPKKRYSGDSPTQADKNKKIRFVVENGSPQSSHRKSSFQYSPHKSHIKEDTTQYDLPRITINIKQEKGRNISSPIPPKSSIRHVSYSRDDKIEHNKAKKEEHIPSRKIINMKEKDYDSEETFHLSIDYPEPPKPKFRSSQSYSVSSIERYNTETLQFRKISESEYAVIFLVKDKIRITSKILLKGGKIHLKLEDRSTEVFESPEELISRYINKIIANCNEILDHPRFNNHKLKDKSNVFDYIVSHANSSVFKIRYSPIRTSFFFAEFFEVVHNGFKFRQELYSSLERLISALREEDNVLLDRKQKDKICWPYFILESFCGQNNCEKAHRFNKWNLPKVFRDPRVSEKKFNEKVQDDLNGEYPLLCYKYLSGTCRFKSNCRYSHVVNMHMLREEDINEINLCIQQNQQREEKKSKKGLNNKK